MDIFICAVFAVLLVLIILCSAVSLYLSFPKKPSMSQTLQIEDSKGFLRGYQTAEKERYTVTSYDGYIIHAELLPALEKSNKYVILSHGYTYDRHGSVKYTHLFKELGYNCIIFDHRGHGENKKFKCTFGINESKDLKAIIEDAYARFGKDIFLGLHGESMGAGTQIMTLKDCQSLKFAVNDCGYASFDDVLRFKLGQYHLPSALVNIISIFSKILMGFTYKEASPVSYITENTVPICFIHGGSDMLIPKEHSIVLSEKTKGYSEVNIFDSADHAKSFETDEKRYFEILKSFLKRAENENFEKEKIL